MDTPRLRQPGGAEAPLSIFSETLHILIDYARQLNRFESLLDCIVEVLIEFFEEKFNESLIIVSSSLVLTAVLHTKKSQAGPSFPDTRAFCLARPYGS